MSVFSASLSTVPISFFDTSGSLVYIPAGTSESLFNLIDDDLQTFVNASSSMKVESINEDLEFKDPRNSTTFLYLSSSGNHSRIGIGTTDPQSTIDFRDAEDSTTGTEIILRTSRLTKGAELGDEGGSINFTIDSSSFASLKTSGSLAKIKALVNQVGIGGVQGLLAFTLSKGAGAEGIDAFKYGYAIGGEGANFAQVQTGSLIIKDRSALASSKIKMLDTNGVTKLQILDGHITASGNISASGTIYANRFHSAQGGEAIDFNDSIDLEGNLTASGNISASGNIYANDLDLAGSVISQQLNVQGNITASGDISASGDMFSKRLKIKDSIPRIALIPSAVPTTEVQFDGTSGNLRIDVDLSDDVNDSTFKVTLDGISNDQLSLNTDGELTLTGGITASGDISCSGDLIGNINGGTF